MNGAISTGKEANVLKGITKDETYVAVKIYRIATSDFKKWIIMSMETQDLMLKLKIKDS